MGTASRAAAVLLLTAAAGWAAAQGAGRFTARLSTAPVDLGNEAAVKGSGAVSAVLDGAELTVEGEFSGMTAPATAAHLHVGRVMGVRGPAVADLEVDGAAAGAVTGTVRLSREQAAALADGRMYVQIDSDAAPDGNLWGWL
jgi:hypothetical protein